MADLNAIRNGLAVRLATTGLNAFGQAPGSISVPAAVIIPGRPAIVYGATFDGEVTINLLAIVLVSAANDSSGQDMLDAYVSSSGAASINAAVNGDSSLGGTCEFAIVQSVQQYGLVEYAGQSYLGATFLIQCGAHG